MPTVRLRDLEEYPEPSRKRLRLEQAWFNVTLPAPTAMGRVLQWDPAFGNAHSRALKRVQESGEFSRAEKELVAAVVSGLNACEY